MKIFNQLNKAAKMELIEAAIDGKDIEAHNQYTEENNGWTKTLMVNGTVNFNGNTVYRIA